MSVPLGHPLIGLGKEPVVDISCKKGPCSPSRRSLMFPDPTLFWALLPPAFYSGAVVTVYIWDEHITVHLTIAGRAVSPRESCSRLW